MMMRSTCTQRRRHNSTCGAGGGRGTRREPLTEGRTVVPLPTGTEHVFMVMSS